MGGLDEEIPNPLWFTELIPRLLDRKGRLIWSATAQVGTAHLFELSQRAEEIAAAGDENPRVTEHFMNVLTNVYIDEQSRIGFLDDLKSVSDEEYEVRGLGNFAMGGRAIYPEFSPKGPHHIDTFLIPEDWTRGVAIDPGRQVAAALFIAIPPPNCIISDRPVVYDEAYIRKCNAMKFAEIMDLKIGESHIQYWVIDHLEGRKTETGSGRTIEEQYAEELIKLHVDERGFHGFAWAAGNREEPGILACHGKLQLRSGRPEWLWMTDKLPWFCWEIKRFMDKRDPSTGIISDRPLGGQEHLMDCFRFLALHPMRYRKPPPRGGKKRNWAVKFIEAKKKRQRQADGLGDAVKLW